MIRLGFPVRIVSKPMLRAHDGRRGTAPHLSINLAYLRDILGHLQQTDVRFYRMTSVLLTQVPPEAALRQLDECAAELENIATQVQSQDVRLTLHLGHHIALGSADAALVARNLAEIEVQALFLERLDARRPSEARRQGVMVAHVGGSPGDIAALQRFATRYMALSPHARARLAVEHDAAGFSLGALLWLHQHCGVPVVFDFLHWQRHNPEQLPLDLALGLALATWSADVRPKVHLSSARSEAHLLPGRHGQVTRVLPPRPGQHADFVAISDMLQLIHAARGLPHFDLMLEAKAGDLALLRVREEIARVAPDAARLLR